MKIKLDLDDRTLLAVTRYVAEMDGQHYLLVSTEIEKIDLFLGYGGSTMFRMSKKGGEN